MTDIEFPDKDLMFGNVMNLHRFYGSENLQNIIIYDGTFKLNAFDPEEIERAITMIDVTLNTMAFAYDASVQWRLKYNLVDERKGFIKVEEKDFDVLKAIFDKFPRNKDELILHSAIDWYNRGVAAKDVFAGFFCYYRVIETIATSIYNSRASFGLGFKKIKKNEAKQRSLDCIEEKYRQLYNKDKIHFINSAYNDCIEGTRPKTKQVLKLIFGEDSKYIKDLFEDTGDKKRKSLYYIRNRIAHGSLTLLKKNDVKLVRSRLWDIQRIAKDLIMRLSCSLKPSDELPKWSGKGGLAISGYDPRAYLVVNTESIFPKDVDWKIKPEWCV